MNAAVTVAEISSAAVRPGRPIAPAGGRLPAPGSRQAVTIG